MPASLYIDHITATTIIKQSTNYRFPIQHSNADSSCSRSDVRGECARVDSLWGYFITGNIVGYYLQVCVCVCVFSGQEMCNPHTRGKKIYNKEELKKGEGERRIIFSSVMMMMMMMIMVVVVVIYWEYVNVNYSLIKPCYNDEKH
jgi:Na+/melibiose symporter-like transporter